MAIDQVSIPTKQNQISFLMFFTLIFGDNYFHMTVVEEI